MCNRNKILDTVNCQYIDTSNSKSPYFQGRLLSTIFTFNQTGIITSSTLVDLTCRNTWCVTDWQRRPKTSILKVKSLSSFTEQNFAKLEQLGFRQNYASTSSAIGSTYDELNITYGPHNFNQNTMPFYNNGLYKLKENCQHIDYPQARRLSSCMFETRNESKSNLDCREPLFMPSLNGLPTINIVRSMHPQCTGSLCNKNTNHYSPYQQNPFSIPTHRATTWNCVRHRPSSNMFEIQDMHVPVYRLQEFSPNPVFESRMLLPKSATSNVKYKKTELPAECKNGQQKEVTPDLNLDMNISTANNETAEQKFECPQCNFRCSNRGQLTGHIRMHTGNILFCLSNSHYDTYM